MVESCARAHPTQIIVHRYEGERVVVSIVPDKDNSPEDDDRRKDFEIEFNRVEELYYQFAYFTNEDQRIMGIRTANSPTRTKTFSRDILHIERLDPREDSFMIINVPGLFRVTTPGLTTSKDCEVVRALVKWYMKDSETRNLIKKEPWAFKIYAKPIN